MSDRLLQIKRLVEALAVSLSGQQAGLDVTCGEPCMARVVPHLLLTVRRTQVMVVAVMVRTSMRVAQASWLCVTR